MKITLKIETDHQEHCEINDLKIYLHANDMFLAITETRDIITDRLKFGEDVSPQERRFLERLDKDLNIERFLQ